MKYNYSKAILELRAKLNVSQSKMAKQLDVSLPSISRWENGHHEPTILAKVRLAKLFEENKIMLEEVNDDEQKTKSI